ncbi:hypothetical protein [Branchiibius cervicis]|uniref:Uncharacterized protein n=1 Tax=Branchiibius cervicis TaxID=908252 RepID=A0ABW2AXR6_9MICO
MGEAEVEGVGDPVAAYAVAPPPIIATVASAPVAMTVCFLMILTLSESTASGVPASSVPHCDAQIQGMRADCQDPVKIAGILDR